VTILLVILAVLVGCGGLLFLSNATAGVGIIAFGCLLAILARIAQASDYESDRKKQVTAGPHAESRLTIEKQNVV
jgi:hypothetical protein